MESKHLPALYAVNSPLEKDAHEADNSVTFSNCFAFAMFKTNNKFSTNPLSPNTHEEKDRYCKGFWTRRFWNRFGHNIATLVLWCVFLHITLIKPHKHTTFLIQLFTAGLAETTQDVALPSPSFYIITLLAHEWIVL